MNDRSQDDGFQSTRNEAARNLDAGVGHGGLPADWPDFPLPEARDRKTRVHIVGGGLAGLIASIHLAERGARVVLHEARKRLGGRAESRGDQHVTNLGPHALYRHGAFEAWLERERLLPPSAFPSLLGMRLHHRGRLRRLPLPLLPAMRSARRTAPIDRCYRDWATETLGARAAEAAIGFARLPTYHPDPGSLSAAFVHERIQRSALQRPVYYVQGGWASLVERLEQRLRGLGAELQLGQKVDRLPDGPCIVATELTAAAALFDDESMTWPSAPVALLDLALTRKWRDPSGVLSTDLGVYVSDYASVDGSLAPRGEALVQCVAGIGEGERFDDAHARIEATLDIGFLRWRDRVTWKRRYGFASGASPADPPGTTWRDRPAIDRGAGRFLVGDRVAAPGVLAETAYHSAREAARQMLTKFLA